jgi:hypothetical protein
VFSELVVVQVVTLGRPARRCTDGQCQLHESADRCGWGSIGIPLSEGHTIACADVTYRRLDSQRVTVPSAMIYRANDVGKLDDYRSFVDLSPVYS